MQLDEKSAKLVIKHVRKLWGYSVQLKSIDNKNAVRQLIIEP
jgi:spore cortex formation protein SpoVR/YcgB (stage V sporulation)